MEIAKMNTTLFKQEKSTESKDKLTVGEFDEIFDQYYKRVYKYICYRTDDRNAAEDLCSQVFERVINKYHTFSSEKSSFEVWLFAIARNIVTDYHRSGKSRILLSLDNILDMISPNSAPDEKIMEKDRNEKLLTAMGKLSEKERNIVAMKYAAGLKNSEIAALFGISDSNVGVVLYRSLKKLQKLLDLGGYERE
jgi:RNA polymerase sigma factor, sigma-70 family